MKFQQATLGQVGNLGKPEDNNIPSMMTATTTAKAVEEKKQKKKREKGKGKERRIDLTGQNMTYL